MALARSRSVAGATSDALADARAAAPVVGRFKARATAQAAARRSVAAHRDEGSGALIGQLWGIAELCREYAVSPRAVRFYEDKGLLEPHRLNGARVYTRRDRARLALILRAKAIGSSLAEIKHFLDLYGARGEGRSQQLSYVLRRTDEAIAELERKRADIDATLAELRVINAGVRSALAARR